MHKMILIDIEKCGGCRTCETACSWSHEKGVFNPRRGMISVIKREKEGSNTPFMCLQCEEPFCMEVCPVKAISVDETTGAKIVDPDKCIGCKMCVIACPFGGVAFDPRISSVVKCDFCKDKGEPQCVKWCPKEVLQYIDVDQAGLIKKSLGIKKLVDFSVGGLNP